MCDRTIFFSKSGNDEHKNKIVMISRRKIKRYHGGKKHRVIKLLMN